MTCAIVNCDKEATDVIYVEMYVEIHLCEEHASTMIDAILRQRNNVVSKKLDKLDH